MNEEQESWLTLTIRDSAERGVEPSRLARILDELSSALFAIARERIGKSVRRGRRTAEEEALAGARVLRVTPGSTSIELVPPPSATQLRMDLPNVVTPDDVALDFYEEMRRAQDHAPVPVEKIPVYRRVRSLLREASEIGSRVDITYRPLHRRPTFPQELVLRASVSTQELPKEVEIAETRRTRRLSGHAYMVDVEKGRQRIRIKLPDNRDVTLDVDEHLIDRIHEALNQVVSLDVEELLEGAAVERRVVQEIVVLPPARGSLLVIAPPKTLEQLADDQEIPVTRSDYVALASKVWTSRKELDRFDRYLQDIRGGSARARP